MLGTRVWLDMPPTVSWPNMARAWVLRKKELCEKCRMAGFGICTISARSQDAETDNVTLGNEDMRGWLTDYQVGRLRDWHNRSDS
jgi:hypothetical protein